MQLMKYFNHNLLAYSLAFIHVEGLLIIIMDSYLFHKYLSNFSDLMTMKSN